MSFAMRYCPSPKANAYKANNDQSDDDTEPDSSGSSLTSWQPPDRSHRGKGRTTAMPTSFHDELHSRGASNEPSRILAIQEVGVPGLEPNFSLDTSALVSGSGRLVQLQVVAGFAHGLGDEPGADEQSEDLAADTDGED